MDATDTLSAALHVLAGDVCLCVGPGDMRKCKPFVLPSVSRIYPEALSTWLCRGGHLFTLFKTDCKSLGQVGTLIFSHTNEVLYHASIDAQLSSDCPADLCFLCQFTTDSSPEGVVPRLLAFDVLSHQPPAARGAILREMQAHLPHPLCCVQWVGPRRYISSEFIAGLPHRIGGLVSLGDDPLAAGALDSDVWG